MDKDAHANRVFHAPGISNPRMRNISHVAESKFQTFRPAPPGKAGILNRFARSAPSFLQVGPKEWGGF